MMMVVVADTIGKQEAFDWGCGWVAIRAVAWSPFDEHLFATTGNRDATVEQPFKSLTVSFERHSVLGTADAVSLNTRAFCERDAALHRLRLSSNTPGDYPCYLAAGGHAGLVILLELQEAFDTLVSTFFLPPSKKIGRPKKMFATVGGHHSPKTGSNKQTEIPVPATSAGRKIRTLGSYAKAKGMHTALSKYKKASGKGKVKAKLQKQKKSFIQEDGEVEVEDSIEDEEEPEYVEDDEEDEESDVSVLIEDSSDDDRVSVSTDEVEEEETPATTSNPEEARLMKEYQLDLSEEDAYLLALQMSEFDDGPPASASEVNKDTPSSVRNPQEPQTRVVAQQSANGNIKAKPKAKAKSKTTAKAKVAVKTKVTTKASKRRSRPSSSTAKKTNEVGVTDADPGAEESPKANAGDKQASGEVECKESTPALVEKAAIPLTTTAVTASPKKTKLKQPKKAPTRKPSPKTKRESPMLLEAINQAMAWQAFEYQLGMSEEDALKEALRLSEIGDTTRSSRSNQPVLSEPVSAALPTPTQPKQTPVTPRTKGASQKKQKKVKDLKEPEAKSDAVSTEERSRPQTPRRLEFSPLNGSEGGDHVEVPPANIDSEPAAVSPAAPAVETSASAPAIAPSPKKPSPKKSPALQAAKPTSEKQNKTAKSPTSATQTPKKKPAERKQPASASAAVPATPQGKKPIKRARSTGAKPAGPQPKKRKKTATPRGGRQHSGASNDAVMSEEDALLLALKMSEIEY
ncbi:unnamed protein product [Phytophthora lilii]|uniref:Unnamed protein product n=1 Tax=Phytophthora lilii TaxID=2077276 RepID=A0A9W6UA22_9STRA|nr:unnamed protein product [Phytophthora lilii]